MSDTPRTDAWAFDPDGQGDCVAAADCRQIELEFIEEQKRRIAAETEQEALEDEITDLRMSVAGLADELNEARAEIEQLRWALSDLCDETHDLAMQHDYPLPVQWGTAKRILAKSHADGGQNNEGDLICPDGVSDTQDVESVSGADK